MGRFKSALFQISDRQQPQETEMAKIYVRHIYYEVILQPEWCWSPLQWPMVQVHGLGAHWSMPWYQRENHPEMQEIIGDTRVAGQVFLCLIVLLTVFLSSCCYVWGNQGNKVWPSGHLQEQLCCTDTCASQGWHQKPGTKQHRLCIPEHHWYTLNVLHTKQKKRQHTMGKTVFEASRSQIQAGY